MVLSQSHTKKKYRDLGFLFNLYQTESLYDK